MVFFFFWNHLTHNLCGKIYIHDTHIWLYGMCIRTTIMTLEFSETTAVRNTLDQIFAQLGEWIEWMNEISKDTVKKVRFLLRKEVKIQNNLKVNFFPIFKKLNLWVFGTLTTETVFFSHNFVKFQVPYFLFLSYVFLATKHLVPDDEYFLAPTLINRAVRTAH